MIYLIFTLLFWIALTVGLIWAVLWILYRLIVSAVRRGILEADTERARIAGGLAPTQWSILKARPVDPAP